MHAASRIMLSLSSTLTAFVRGLLEGWPGRLSATALAFFALTSPVFSARNACDLAIEFASERTAIPVSLLRAIALVESGFTQHGKFIPWPWTINEAGKSARFKTSADAVAEVRQRLATGATNVDIGCFQINYRWHQAGFASLEDMFDPKKNALYAAEYLRALKHKHGTWVASVGAYHSQDPQKARGYADRVAAHIDTAHDSPGGSEGGASPADPSRSRLLRPGTRALLSGALRPLINTHLKQRAFIELGRN